ncbi:MAG: SIS domain-containing protein [Halobacteriota archaeon]
MGDDTLRSYVSAKEKLVISTDNIHHIVGAGMGGSGQPVFAASSLLNRELRLPIVSSQTYGIPGFVGPNTLFVAISHSGGTEETIEQYCLAKDRGAQTVVIATGGKLLEMAKEDGVPWFRYESRYPPRASFAFMFGAFLACLERAGAIEDCYPALQEAKEIAEKVQRRNAREVGTDENTAKTIALALQERTPLVYIEPPFDGIGPRFTKTMNENASRFAFYNVLPELRHNEIMCWAVEPKPAQYLPIFVRDDARFSSLEREVDAVRERVGSDQKELLAEGESLLARFFSLLVVVDAIAYYEAILMDKDPRTTFALDDLKAELTQLSRPTPCR